MGCDLASSVALIISSRFQSTHPRGVRPGDNLVYAILGAISIHAPTWGATGRTPQTPSRGRNFNPRTHVGCDARRLRGRRSVFPFQSTHPRGVRRAPSSSSPPVLFYFNPRTHVGCDITATVRHNMARDFNPRTHVGCDPLPAPVVRAVIDFNPRTHVGCDSLVRYIAGIVADFNPRTHVGCDLPASVCPHRLPISIHAPTWGATRFLGRQHLREEDFNPRTHVGCDTKDRQDLF